MKLKFILSIIFLLPISIAYADTAVSVDSEQTCANRITAFKTALQNAIDKKQNVEESKEQLDQINKLPKNLSACEKQKRIPALVNDETANTTNEAQKDRKISQ